MSRVFPSGSRLFSSNYNPMGAWNIGCQMVALNYQAQGPPMIINKGRFTQNGNSGYVLKPNTLTLTNNFNPAQTKSVQEISQTITITVSAFEPYPQPFAYF